VAAVTPENRTFDPAGLLRLLDGRYAGVRHEIRTVMRRPAFARVVALPTPEYRERVLEWARALAAEGLTAPGFPERYGGRGDPGITREVNRLCNETRLRAGDLVDALGIPDEVVAAPIGLSDPGSAQD
jgi:alkylation response protein AidB-like acyl-CoA dehydrogenase